MLREEAAWLGDQMDRVSSKSLGPVLDVGSSSETFRKVRQPWVWECVYGRLESRSIEVRHLDLEPGPGVDLVGDVTDPAFRETLSGHAFGSVLCANLLEHVEKPVSIARALVEVLPPGGHIFVSCPYRFPYHPDPIDTGLRPGVEELAVLFPSTELLAGDIVRCGTYLDHLYPLLPRWKSLSKHALRMGMPLYGPRVWALKVMHLPWLFRSLEATCLVLRRR